MFPFENCLQCVIRWQSLSGPVVKSSGSSPASGFVVIVSAWTQVAEYLSQRPDSEREGPHLELSWSENKQRAIWGWARVTRRRRWWRRRWRGALGTTSVTSSSPAWATRSGSATCGGSPISATSTEVRDSFILLRRLRLESVLRLGLCLWLAGGNLGLGMPLLPNHSGGGQEKRRDCDQRSDDDSF